VVDRALATRPEATLRALTPLAVRLGRRDQGGWILGRVEAALRGRPMGGAAVLQELLDGPDRRTRYFAARLALSGPAPADARTYARTCARRAAAETDPATARLWTDAALAVLAADGPDDAAIDTLIGAVLPPVRAAGVTALRGAGRATEGVRHLADSSGFVRACARWLVGRDGSDPRAHYRWLIADPAGPSPYAVTGLAECGGHEDVPLLRELLAHPVGRVRGAAVAGLRRLHAVVEDAVLLALLDDAPSVAGEAARSLVPVVHRLDPAYLAERLGPRLPQATRQAAFRLLRARGGIHELRACVALIEDWDPRTRKTARATVRGWDWRPERVGGQEARPELAALLRKAAGLFTEQELARLRGVVEPRR
jgi:HEAT repeat protein